MVTINYVTTVEIIPGAFAVEARAEDGRWFQHQGPERFAYFTKEQADRLAGEVRRSGRIRAELWIDGTERRYGTEAHELHLIELERSEA